MDRSPNATKCRDGRERPPQLAENEFFSKLLAGAIAYTMRLMKLATYTLLALLLVEQYALWFGTGSIMVAWDLHREIDTQRGENSQLKERNQTLAAEVVDLKRGLDAIEERARMELGMVKQGEMFYRVVENPVE